MNIIETTGGSVTNTKQFVRSGHQLREARDLTGILTAQYFANGQTASSSNYFYQLNLRNDVVSVTDSSGSLVASAEYDPYGRPMIFSNSFIPDFGFTGLYLHQQSGLNLATYRAYDFKLGRWINRDPIEEAGGRNLYSYVTNQPLGNIDPSGLQGLDRGGGFGEGFQPLTKACDKAQNIAKDLFKKYPNDVNNYGDARRHAEWAYRVSKEVGPRWAYWFGFFHESVDGLLEPIGENLMDLHNNQEGINAFNEGRQINDANLQTSPQ